MAFYGISKLQAVNLILETNQIKRVSALDSTGSWPSKTYGASDAGHAEWILDVTAERRMIAGTLNNVIRKSYVLAANGAITLDANTMKIKPIGLIEKEHYTIRDDKVYDAWNGTTTLAAGTYTFEQTMAVDFESLEPALKHAIVDEAKLYYQRRTRGDQLQDLFNENDRQKTDANVMRPKMAVSPVPPPPSPMQVPQQ
mgnify:CR=1 FL=1